MYEKSESLRSSDSVHSAVDLWGKYPRKYWSIKKCSITVRCRSTVGGAVDNSNFRNEFRYFLYTLDPELTGIIDDMKLEDLRCLGKYEDEHDTTVHSARLKHYLKALGLDDSVSIQIREYEKEFFQLKCLALEQKPQIILRGLLRLAQTRKRDEIFTAPETLFNLIAILPGKAIYRKNVKFMF